MYKLQVKNWGEWFDDVKSSKLPDVEKQQMKRDLEGKQTRIVEC